MPFINLDDGSPFEFDFAAADLVVMTSPASMLPIFTRDNDSGGG